MNLLDLDMESFFEVSIAGRRYRQERPGYWRSGHTSLGFGTDSLRSVASRAGVRIKPVVKYRWTE